MHYVEYLLYSLLKFHRKIFLKQKDWFFYQVESLKLVSIHSMSLQLNMISESSASWINWSFYFFYDCRLMCLMIPLSSLLSVATLKFAVLSLPSSALISIKSLCFDLMSKRKRSSVWDYFSGEGSATATCSLCEIKVKRGPAERRSQWTSTHLWKHLERHHSHSPEFKAAQDSRALDEEQAKRRKEIAGKNRKFMWMGHQLCRL